METDTVAATVAADHVAVASVDECSTRVSELLHEAAETHHRVIRITDGADDD